MSKNHENSLDDVGRKATVEEQQCTRCNKKFWPKIGKDGKMRLPGHCPHCNSPYWTKPIKFPSISKAKKK